VCGAHHLGFIDEPSFPRPSLACSVPALAIDMLGLARDLRRATSPLHGRLRLTLQNRIAGHIDEVFRFRFAVQKIQNFRSSEATVESHSYSRLGKGIAHPCN